MENHAVRPKAPRWLRFIPAPTPKNPRAER